MLTSGCGLSKKHLHHFLVFFVVPQSEPDQGWSPLPIDGNISSLSLQNLVTSILENSDYTVFQYFICLVLDQPISMARGSGRTGRILIHQRNTDDSVPILGADIAMDDAQQVAVQETLSHTIDNVSIAPVPKSQTATLKCCSKHKPNKHKMNGVFHEIVGFFVVWRLQNAAWQNSQPTNCLTFWTEPLENLD